MRSLRELSVFCVLFVVLSSYAAADPPTYQPYGAWRGRIRYVEGLRAPAPLCTGETASLRREGRC